MKNIIDDLNYHLNTLSTEEEKIIDNYILLLYKEDSKLKEYVKKALEKNKKYSELEKENIFKSFVAANIHYIIKENSNLDESGMLKAVRTNIYIYFTYLIKNINYFLGTNFVQFEPRAICCDYLANFFIQNQLPGINLDSNKFTYNSVYNQELTAFYRAIRSSLFLLYIGDDVHSFSLIRGVVELACKIKLAPNFKKDFVKFKEYNNYLQDEKNNNKKIPNAMIQELGDDARSEETLCYGWVKNKNGKRISSLTEMIKIAFPEEKDRILSFIHMSSEFVHEDYNHVGYDYIDLRNQILSFHYHLLKNTIFLFEDELEEKRINEINNLFCHIE